MHKIPLKFSDIEFGTDEYGYIPTIPGEDPDDADMRYTQHLRDQGIQAHVDMMGNLVVESSRAAERFTESQLRRIIRQELLHEASIRSTSARASTMEEKQYTHTTSQTWAPRVLTPEEMRQLLRKGKQSRREVDARLDRMERVDTIYRMQRSRGR